MFCHKFMFFCNLLTQREARKLLAEGTVSTYEKAELVVQLRTLNFKEEECILAAKECSTVDAAITFLQQECDLCAGKYSMKQVSARCGFLLL